MREGAKSMGENFMGGERGEGVCGLYFTVKGGGAKLCICPPSLPLTKRSPVVYNKLVTSFKPFCSRYPEIFFLHGDAGKTKTCGHTYTHTNYSNPLPTLRSEGNKGLYHCITHLGSSDN